MTTWVPRLSANSWAPPSAVLGGDAALLVRGGPEWEVGVAEQAVVGDGAVAGGEHVGQVGAHEAVDGYRLLGAELGPGGGRQVAVGPHANHHEHGVGGVAERLRQTASVTSALLTVLAARSPASTASAWSAVKARTSSTDSAPRRLSAKAGSSRLRPLIS